MVHSAVNVIQHIYYKEHLIRNSKAEICQKIKEHNTNAFWTEYGRDLDDVTAVTSGISVLPSLHFQFLPLPFTGKIEIWN